MSHDFETIGPYQIVSILGQGGMGTVYKGVHARSQEPVAIKVIAPSMAQFARFRRRFDAEIQTLLRLKHPNIVQLIGFGEERGLLFYSMEFVDGDNLHQLLRKEKRFAWDSVLDWAIEICGALKHAHDFGIIHRDLKPANLMINLQGHVKLTDFGIAKLFGSNEQTAPGSVLGTADFMPPEQAEGKPVTVRSDLYALGAICYAALAGRTPFTGTNIPEILFNVRYGTLTPLQELAPDTPKEFADLVEELLKRDPMQRPPTAIVVSKRLQALRAGLARSTAQTFLPTRSSAPSNEIPTDLKNVSELTSIDMSDHPSIANIGDDPNRTRVLGKENIKTATPAQQGQRSPARDANDWVAGPHEDTKLAAEGVAQELPEFPSGLEQMRSTNFTPVTDSDRKRSALVLSENRDDDDRSPWMSVLGVSLLIVACIAAAYWFSRPPSPDQLFQPIAAAMQTEDEERLGSVEDQARQFVDRYPDDPRSEEVRQLIEELDSNRMVRQLLRRSDATGKQLDALEQAFVDCARTRDTDPNQAKRKLAALIQVFPERDDFTVRQRRIVRSAKKMLQQLEAVPATELRNVALESLQAQLHWVEAHLDAEQRKAWIRSAIELYQDKPWAEEFIASLKRMVDIKP